MLKKSDIIKSLEFEVLLHLLHGKQILTNSTNSEHLLQLVNDHRIHGPILQALNTSNYSFTELNSLCVGSKLSQLKLVAVLTEINTFLKTYKWFCIKGPVLSQYLFNDPANRTSKDIDILIDEKDLDPILSEFVNKGYTILTYWNTPKQKKAIVKYYHHIELLHPNGEVVVELHWKLFKYVQIDLNFEEAVNNSSSVKLAQDDYLIFEKEYLMYYLIIHGLQHGFYRLQWLHDIFKFTQIEPDIFDRMYRKFGDNPFSKRAIDSTIILLHTYFEYSKAEYAGLIESGAGANLVNYCMKEIALNDSYINSHPIKRFKKVTRVHYLNYLLGGFSVFLKGLFIRNVRPKNWKFFAFPDSIFFLNHLFSRIISIFNK